MQHYKYIKTYYENGIQKIIMNRPDKKNAMNSDMLEEIKNALENAEANNEVVIVVLTGAGDYYSSGNDMELKSDSDIDYNSMILKKVDITRNFIDFLIDFKKILIAIVNGPAVGMAVTSLGLCDIAYAADEATFHTPFVALGLCAEACSSQLFPAILGNSKAYEMLYMGKKITAEEAKNVGLVADVFNQKEICNILWPKISRLVRNKETLLANKQLMKKFKVDFLHQVNEAEFEELRRRITSEEFMGALAAFAFRSKL